jgi:hypothetical protein
VVRETKRNAYGPVDWLARAYASGRLRMASEPRADPTADPSYNPYARED